MREPFRDEARALERVVRHRYGALVVSIAEEESFVSRSMFGGLACYAHGRLKLVLTAGDEPWDGILVPTAAEHHASLRAALPSLRVHPILRKWLYLAAAGDGFEDDAARVMALVHADDPRVGVEPKPRRTREVAPRAARRMRSRR